MEKGQTAAGAKITNGSSPTSSTDKSASYDMTSLNRMTRYRVSYLGCLELHRKVTKPMLRWILVEIKLHNSTIPPNIGHLTIKGSDLDLVDSNDPKRVLIRHNVHNVFQFSICPVDIRCFFYLHHDNPSKPITMFAFRCDDENLKVQEVFQAVQRAAKNSAKPPPPSKMNKFNPHIKPFEVKYQGRSYVNEKKKSGAFLDSWIQEKFARKDAPDGQSSPGGSYSELRSRHASSGSITSVDTGVSSLHSERRRSRTCSEGDDSSPMNSPRMRDNSDLDLSSHLVVSRLDSGVSVCEIGRQNSVASSTSAISDIFEEVDGGRDGRRKTLITVEDLNKTMLLQVDEDRMSVISLDRKTVILEKTFQEISYCTQGAVNTDHFGVICYDPYAKREDKKNCYAIYIFQCTSAVVSTELMETLKRAFNTAAKRNQEKMSCELCPMVQFNKLCEDISYIKDSETLYNCIQTHIQNLSASDYSDLMNKVKTESCISYLEANDVLMTKLRIICEIKQIDHVHKRESEMFNLSLHRQNKMNVLRNRAKKALAYDAIGKSCKLQEVSEWKPPSTCELPLQDSHASIGSESPSPSASPRSKSAFQFSNVFLPRQRSRTLAHTENGPATITEADSLESVTEERPDGSSIFRRLSTMGHSLEEAIKERAAPSGFSRERSPKKDTRSRKVSAPVITNTLGIFDDDLTPTSSLRRGTRRGSSWRRDMFESVITAPPRSNKRRTAAGLPEVPQMASEEIRARWRCAIEQTILLNRMERENRNLIDQEEKRKERSRSHLSYEEVPIDDKAKSRWQNLLSKVTDKTQDNAKATALDLWQHVKDGVPKNKRGEIWCILARQYKASNSSPSLQQEVDSKPEIEDYSQLLQVLTPHQHDILIDLGRTFPQHPYFQHQLGAGQLAMFNVLKAYSLIDEEVGYCQGLAFVTGILLMHLEERECFNMLVHLMYDLGLRKLYKHDMTGLQIALYQLIRLLRDRDNEIYTHLEDLEINPTLYAAPWFMTLFSSEFPIGFASRVFDFLYMEGYDAVFKIALALIIEHKELILAADNFETVCDVLKRTIPEMDVARMENIFNTASSSDLGIDLYTYEVEYHVFREDVGAMAGPRTVPSENMVQSYEQSLQRLQQHNTSLVKQVAVQTHKLSNQETMIDALQQSHSKLTMRVQAMEEEKYNQSLFIERLLHFVPKDKLAVLEKEFPGMKSQSTESGTTPHRPLTHTQSENAIKLKENQTPKTNGEGFMSKFSKVTGIFS